MPEPRGPVEPIHPEVRYERSDASIRGIIAFGIGLAVLGFAIHLGLAGLFASFKKQEAQQHPPLPPLAAKERLQLPRDLNRIPEPRLQTSEIADMQQLRRQEEVELHGYGWVDRQAGIVHMPIEEAIRLLEDPKTAAAHGIRVQAAKEQKGGKPFGGKP